MQQRFYKQTSENQPLLPLFNEREIDEIPVPNRRLKPSPNDDIFRWYLVILLSILFLFSDAGIHGAVRANQ